MTGRRRRRAIGLAAAVAATVSGCGGPDATRPTVEDARPAPPRAPVRLVPVPAGSLPAPSQDAAAAGWNGGAVLVGGARTATAGTAIVVVDRAGARVVGRLPAAVREAALVRLGSLVYLFGGSDGAAAVDRIVRIDPRTGAAERTAALPAPSSASSAAVVGGTAYVVGGQDGGRLLDTIVAWRPGGEARVVGRLPQPLRDAAVAAVDGRIVIAGGSVASGAASSAVYAYTPGDAGAVRIARLPRPTTRAAAAAVGDTAYVLGGLAGATLRPTRAILAVRGGRVSPAGRLAAPLSDLAAAPLRGGVLVAGGRARGRAVAAVSELVPPARASTIRVRNVYASDRAGALSPAVRGAKPYVYVPNSDSNTVDVIDQRTFRIVRHFAVGGLPQHVVPAWNLRTLYVTNNTGNSLTPIDPTTGAPGKPIPVVDPYNMYFTPDGRDAIVVAERLHRLDFRSARTFRLRRSLVLPCRGADHMDFSADGRYAFVSCEFSAQIVEVDVRRRRVVDTLTLRPGAAPQDSKLAPDGRVLYVADMNSNGVWIVDARRFRVLRFLPTGRGAHGLYPSRDARFLYVTNRLAGSVSVVSFRTGRIVKTWRIPGGTPDMGNVSADGKVLWLSGRYSGEVYALSTRDGRLLARIRVGAGPHGVAVWPQPGRYSLGHTGVLR